jgi:hypothetical protein
MLVFFLLVALWSKYLGGGQTVHVVFKGTQAWDNFEIFLTYIKSLYALRKFSKKISASFPSIFAKISMFEHFRGDWAYAEPNFLDELSKNFFSLNLHFGSITVDGFLDGFWKFRLFIVKIWILVWYFWVFLENYSMRMLSIRGNDFIAHWAYEERISAHAQPAVKCEQFLHVQSMLGIRGTNFIAHWAYAERISSHAEHTWNRFHSMLSMRGNV